MNRRLATLAITVALATVMAAAAPRAQSVSVSLRVESSEAPAPLFDGPIDTAPHPVDGSDGSGSHPCSGPPGAAPAATATGALDDAMRGAGIPWRGNWDPSFRDFFVERIGPFASRAPDRYWSLSVNGRFSAGGCLTQVAAGDSVRFFYGPLFGNGEAGGTGGGSVDPPGAAGGGAPGKGGSGASPRRLRRVAASALGFIRTHGGVGEDWARLARALHGDGNPTAAARGLIAARLDSQLPNGSLDRDVNATAIAVLAWHGGRPRAAARAAAWLAETQSPNGGFGYRPGLPTDIDTTGLASWALAVGERQGATRRAAAFVRSSQAPDGGFPALPGGESNAQSTGLGLIALRMSGLGPRRTLSDSGRGPLDYLASLARSNGAIAYQRRSSPTPVWTTAQALLGLTSRAKLLDLNGDGRSAEYAEGTTTSMEARTVTEQLWGGETTKAVDNFPVSGERVPVPVVRWLGRLKAAAAEVNGELGELDNELAERIAAAGEAVAAGEHDDQFPIDVFQTGSGTSSNMNANEVLANLAGDGAHPNDHVNMGQSSNDVFPSAVHLAALSEVTHDLLPAMGALRVGAGGEGRAVRRRGQGRAAPT